MSDDENDEQRGNSGGGASDLDARWLELMESARLLKQLSDSDIFSAAWEGKARLVQAHLDSDAGGVSALDDSEFGGGYFALHYAAYNGHDEVVSLLLAAGAARDERTADGLTPLFLAAQQGRASTVKLLLEAGADLSATANEHAVCAADAAKGHRKVQQSVESV